MGLLLPLSQAHSLSHVYVARIKANSLDYCNAARTAPFLVGLACGVSDGTVAGLTAAVHTVLASSLQDPQYRSTSVAFRADLMPSSHAYPSSRFFPRTKEVVARLLLVARCLTPNYGTGTLSSRVPSNWQCFEQCN